MIRLPSGSARPGRSSDQGRAQQRAFLSGRSTRSESDFVTRVLTVQNLLLTVALQGGKGGLVAGEYILDRALAGNVLDVASRESILVGKCSRILFRKVRNHGLPNLGAGVLLGHLELHLEDEPALEGRVQVGEDDRSDESF